MSLVTKNTLVKASIIILLAVVFYVTLMLHKGVTHTYNKHREMMIDSDDKNGQPLIVLGIWTTDTKADFRNAQRQTWLSQIKKLNESLPFRFVYKFWFDLPSQESIRENDLHGDIEYLNVVNHGRGNRFGKKLYIWIKHLHTYYPKALMGIRIDDDVFACVPQVFQKLDRIKSYTLYYGYTWGKGDKVYEHRFVDEMFVVIGRDLINRIAQRQYCNGSKTSCKDKTQLIDLGDGSPSLGHWLSIYNDVDFHPDNEKVIHHNRAFKGDRSAIITKDFCEKHLVHHKSTPEYINKLHEFNKHVKLFNPFTAKHCSLQKWTCYAFNFNC